MTGPVGSPVGDPPAGSTLTASVGVLPSTASWAALNASVALPVAGSRPSDTGCAPPPGSIQSSYELAAGAGRGFTVVTRNARARSKLCNSHTGPVVWSVTTET